jgi:hypothetical protein
MGWTSKFCSSGCSLPNLDGLNFCLDFSLCGEIKQKASYVVLLYRWTISTWLVVRSADSSSRRFADRSRVELILFVVGGLGAGSTIRSVWSDDAIGIGIGISVFID